jgi:UDP-N-acetylmuramate dehydrogenase
MTVKPNYSLRRHNTFGLDVKTKFFVEYADDSELQTLLRDEYFFSQQFWHIGQGSNLLFLGDYDGIIVHSAIRGIERVGEDSEFVLLKAGAATLWDDFVARCVDIGLGGVENLSLIPGEVGASAVQNIGAYGVEVADCIEEVHARNLVSGEKTIFKVADCDYSYRNSLFKQDAERGKNFITHVVYRLRKKPVFHLDYGNLGEALEGRKPTLQAVRDAVCAIRRAKLPDPATLGNAGSFFVNPHICIEHYEGLKKQFPDIPCYPVNDEVVKTSAAWLIDRCGLKGRTHGDAAVHDRQPLVIVNTGSATGADIAALADEIIAEVKKRFGIELKPEVNYI